MLIFVKYGYGLILLVSALLKIVYPEHTLESISALFHAVGITGFSSVTLIIIAIITIEVLAGIVIIRTDWMSKLGLYFVTITAIIIELFAVFWGVLGTECACFPGLPSMGGNTAFWNITRSTLINSAPLAVLFSRDGNWFLSRHLGPVCLGIGILIIALPVSFSSLRAVRWEEILIEVDSMNQANLVDVDGDEIAVLLLDTTCLTCWRIIDQYQFRNRTGRFDIPIVVSVRDIFEREEFEKRTGPISVLWNFQLDQFRKLLGGKHPLGVFLIHRTSYTDPEFAGSYLQNGLLGLRPFYVNQK